ncbi:hypothetical protein LINPERHAP1_LOCUS25873 [Linum perenne]
MIFLQIEDTTFRLGFICFHFVIVILVTYFSMTVWEFQRPRTF